MELKIDIKLYYDQIVDEIKSLKFKIIEITDSAPEKISPHLEAINYIIYDWNRDHKDDRDLEFEYVIQPETDIDMNEISFDDFFNFITKIKTDENIIIETKGVETIKEVKDVEPEIVEPEIVEPEIVEPEIVEPEIVEKRIENLNKDVDMDFWDSDDKNALTLYRPPKIRNKSI